jgi:FdhE protein
MPLLRNKRATWDQRIARARELAEIYPFASEGLSFYSQIAAFQGSIHAELELAGRVPDRETPFQECLDVAEISSRMPALLALVGRAAPQALAEAAQQLETEGPSYWDYLALSYWQTEGHSIPEAPEAHVFFARVLLQPWAECIASMREDGLPRFNPSQCPICAGKPQVGVLREEGHGAKRSLVCSLCHTEWDYRRVICPGCQEEDFDKLYAYTAEQFEHMRVDACESCRTYMNTVDLTKNGLAIPEVDELAAIPLGLWAQEKGYSKLQLNLLGM